MGKGEREMKLDICKKSLILTPESEIEEAYIEEVLGLKEEGSTAQVIRRNIYGMSGIAYLEIKK